MTIMKRIVFVAASLGMALTASLSTAEAPATGVLTIRISQLHSNTGQVGCALFNSAAGFPSEPTKAIQTRWCAIKDQASTCAFDPIPAGTYAVACFHDENKNGQLDKGLFGIPKEGTVASNHAKGTMGPPPFDKAKFSFPGAATTLDLRMGY
jgi:uncharacterized protein (DUF2141 family)